MNKLHLIGGIGLCFIVVALAVPCPAWVSWALLLFGIGALVFVVAFVIKWTLRPLAHLAASKRHPNEAYDFFSSQPDTWVVFKVTRSALRPDNLPCDSDLSQGKLLGPFEFSVPKLNDRSVTVYGTSQRCFELLDAFVLRMKPASKQGGQGQQPPERDK